MYVTINDLQKKVSVHNDELFSEISEDRTRDTEVTI